ncbi:hypothetical protein HID58_089555 [Brassica napus]|uniref:Nucleoporin NSP1-like C-terminal domain-containing protein n=1 Tax=Brassica napus TaxID=3708 RepID=A0ABQ7XZE3_BRANA|nr:hypothetical protein HID58_089555 [Brassica napus]
MDKKLLWEEMDLRRWPWKEMKTMAVGRDGASTMAVERDGAPMMAVGRDGAPTMAVRCPTGDNASGHHIVFNLQASVPKLLLDDVFSASSSSASVSAPSPFGAAPASGSAPLFGSSSSLFSAPSSAAGSSSPLFATSSSATTTDISCCGFDDWVIVSALLVCVILLLLPFTIICLTSTTVAAPVAGAPKLPSEITGKTVEEEWNTELEECTGSFRKQANAIAEWDKRILHNSDVLLRLEVKSLRLVKDVVLSLHLIMYAKLYVVTALSTNLYMHITMMHIS